MSDQQPEPVTTTGNRTSVWFSVLLGAGALVLALIAADILLIGGLQSKASARTHPVTNIVRVSGAKVAPVVYLSVTPGIKPGPDGKLHDAFSVTDFHVHVGQPVKLVINNTDTVAHSINSPAAGVRIIVKPGTHTYTLLVREAGRFEWSCMMPCDPFSMSHVGYMRGYITAS